MIYKRMPRQRAEPLVTGAASLNSARGQSCQTAAISDLTLIASLQRRLYSARNHSVPPATGKP